MIDDPEKVAVLLAARKPQPSEKPYQGTATGTPVYPKELSDAEIDEILNKVSLNWCALVGRYEPLRIDIIDADTKELQMHFHPVDRNKSVATPANWPDQATLLINLAQVIRKLQTRLKEKENGS